MQRKLTLSIDAMGGDAAPGITIDGTAEFLAGRPDAHVLLHGDEAVLGPLVAAKPALAGKVTIVHAAEKITSAMKPSQALRRGKGSSMWNAVEAVKNGEADASVSAGNTGALMAISMLVLRKMEGVHRPAMTALWPTLRGRTVVLDVGANVEADAEQLVTFAIDRAADVCRPCRYSHLRYRAGGKGGRCRPTPAGGFAGVEARALAGSGRR